MGCSVNGIGECKQADIGVYGSKNKLFIYYKGKQYKTVDINNGFKILCELIDKF
jgi:(E)-4-hydroxy-3-methylbut-2-enyl-diphosphate synthase